MSDLSVVNVTCKKLLISSISGKKSFAKWHHWIWMKIFWSSSSKLGDITEINQNCGFVAIIKTSRKSLQSTICEGAPVSHNSHRRVGVFDYNGNNLQLPWWLAPLSTAAFQWKDGSFTYYQSSTPLPVNREPHTFRDGTTVRITHLIHAGRIVVSARGSRDHHQHRTSNYFNWLSHHSV